MSNPAWVAKQQKYPYWNVLWVAFQRDQLLSAQAGEVCKVEMQLVAGDYISYSVSTVRG
jgi:hypothetical protein